MQEEKRYTPPDAEPGTLRYELQNDLNAIFISADDKPLEPLDGEDLARLQQSFAGRPDLVKGYQVELEKLRQREQVKQAVEALKKWNEIPQHELHESERSPQADASKERARELEAIITLPSDAAVLAVASEAFTMIHKKDLEAQANSSYNKDEQSQKDAKALLKIAKEVITFATERRGIDINEVQKSGKEWLAEEGKRLVNEAFAEAVRLSEQILKLNEEHGGFPISRQDEPEEIKAHKLRAELRRKLNDIIRSNRSSFTKEQVQRLEELKS